MWRTIQQKTPRRMQGQECHMQWMWYQGSFPEML